MERCGVCGKLIWFWQRKIQVKWVVDYKNNPDGETVLYHWRDGCMKPEDFGTKPEDVEKMKLTRHFNILRRGKRCVMCGIEKATKQIPNPNDFGDEMFWDVCDGCADFVKEGTLMSIEIHFAQKEGKPIEPIMEKYGWKKEGDDERSL